MDDKSDIPHAISACVEKCEFIVTFDAHFRNLDKIKSASPDELLEFIKY